MNIGGNIPTDSPSDDFTDTDAMAQDHFEVGPSHSSPVPAPAQAPQPSETLSSMAPSTSSAGVPTRADRSMAQQTSTSFNRRTSEADSLSRAAPSSVALGKRKMDDRVPCSYERPVEQRGPPPQANVRPAPLPRGPPYRGPPPPPRRAFPSQHAPFAAGPPSYPHRREAPPPPSFYHQPRMPPPDAPVYFPHDVYEDPYGYRNPSDPYYNWEYPSYYDRDSRSPPAHLGPPPRSPPHVHQADDPRGALSREPREAHPSPLPGPDNTSPPKAATNPGASIRDAEPPDPIMVRFSRLEDMVRSLQVDVKVVVHSLPYAGRANAPGWVPNAPGWVSLPPPPPAPQPPAPPAQRIGPPPPSEERPLSSRISDARQGEAGHRHRRPYRRRPGKGTPPQSPRSPE